MKDEVDIKQKFLVCGRPLVQPLLWVALFTTTARVALSSNGSDHAQPTTDVPTLDKQARRVR